jgi:uncharacterized protein (TIGR04255 family)
MTKPVPINSLNAIEAMSFVVILDKKELTQEEDKGLLSLKEKLKDDLPTFSQNTKVEAKFDGKIIEQTTKLSGVTLQHLDSNKKPTWLLAINDNQITVNCFAYDSWDKVWPKAKKFIQETLEAIGINNCLISTFSIQCVDKFTQSNLEKDYTFLDIFKANSGYLTKHIAGVGRLWHVHQGWFDEKSKGNKVLNVLNISTVEKDSNLVTAIDHIAQYRFKEPKKILKYTELDSYFKELHENNKTLIKSLLNNNQAKAIGLV